MAADDEFPRGLPLSSAPGPGGQPIITFPATPGIAWVLTDAALTSITTGTLGNNIGLPLEANTMQLSIIGAPVDTPAWSQGPSASWSGQKPFPAGTAVVVQLGGSVPNLDPVLTASAYPI